MSGRTPHRSDDHGGGTQAIFRRYAAYAPPMTDRSATGSGEPALVPCVGGIVFDRRGRLLLVRRANEPGRGLWSVPGGRVEPGEDDHAAVVREMAEETGLRVRPWRLVGVVRRGPYRIADYLCTLDDEAEEGRLLAGDDADDARFVDTAAFAALPLVPELAETLAGWDALPRR